MELLLEGVRVIEFYGAACDWMNVRTEDSEYGSDGALRPIPS